MSYLWAVALAAAVLIGTTLIHYEAITVLDGYARRPHRRLRLALISVILLLVLMHLVEIGLYAGVFALADGPLGLGKFEGRADMSAADYFHFAAESYASLGSADMTATGDLRLITAISPLNGILLLAWSGGFLFSLVDDWRVQFGNRPGVAAPGPSKKME